jgi:hypothetical protein
MKQIRKRLTYANVMSSIAVFLILGGATAFAAHQLGKNTVGSKQLKKNAVTTAKIKKEAVGGAKLKKGAVTGDKIAAGTVSGDKIAANAVTGDKIADGTVTGADINAGNTPFARVTARLRGNSALAVNNTFQSYPVNPNTYSQAPNEVDSYAGAVDLAFSAACTTPRSASAYVLVDPANPLTPTVNDVVAVGQISDSTGGALNRRIDLGPYPGLGGKFEPGTTKTHIVYLVVNGTCSTGSGITASAGAVDVIGTR